MIDMGQADRTLYRSGENSHKGVCWTYALHIAAREMGYPNYWEVPDYLTQIVKEQAKKIQEGAK